MQDPRAAFSTLELRNLPAIRRIQYAPQAPVTCHRKQPPDFPPLIVLGSPKDTRELPQRRPSLLGSWSTATINLAISVGDMVGEGGHGTVHDVEVLNREFYETMALPDLVIKVTYRNTHLPHLSREAFFYEEMECLQGVCIARCYGYFEAVLPDARVISMLLLEKLGPELSKGELVENMPEIEKMYRELWSLGIEHTDIQRLNMLKAPTGPRQLPSLPSPFWEDTYSWRIIDFGLSQKSNRTFEILEDSDLNFLEYLKESIEIFGFDGTIYD